MTPKNLKKALIPAAGWGTRLFPMTKVFKKEFLPIIDQDGQAKPIILVIIEEALRAGVTEIGIVIQPKDRELFENFFLNPSTPKLWDKLSAESRNYEQYLQEIGQKITLIYQEESTGYGQAVFCAKDWVNQEPFLLFLGDHVYRSYTDICCSRQLVEIYQCHQTNIIGLTTMPAKIIHKAGIAMGTWLEKSSLLSLTQLIEKPSLDYAYSYLQVEGMEKETFLGIFGIYLLESAIFDYLEIEISQESRYRGEFQLTTALNQLCQNSGSLGYLVQGDYFDTGMPEFYQQAIAQFYPMGS